MRKPDFCICENKEAQLISAFVFATRIVQSLYYLNPKFQASSRLLWLYSPVCVGPGRKPRKPVFSQHGSFCFLNLIDDFICVHCIYDHDFRRLHRVNEWLHLLQGNAFSSG